MCRCFCCLVLVQFDIVCQNKKYIYNLEVYVIYRIRALSIHLVFLFKGHYLLLIFWNQSRDCASIITYYSMIIIIYDALDHISFTSIHRTNSSLIICQMGILQNRVFIILDFYRYKFTSIKVIIFYQKRID